ncbi:MAG: transglycosylase domain-containing protein [Lachnospiraceae bacterium]|nr:transglycosylase domain-containing protein [Lachnospiraceae bacterium]
MNYGKKQVDEKIEYITGPDARQKNRFKMFLVTTAIAVIAGGVLILASIGIGAFREIISNAPSLDDINQISPRAAKSIIYASDGSVMQELVQSGSNRVNVEYEDLPKDLINAFVVIEDSRFFSHDGVDVNGIIRALISGLTKGRFSEGASTLTQQLIKNNIFNGGMETNFGDRIERKFQEQYLALKAEKELDKKTIVTYYLNTINLGANSLGVQVAARRYFGKDVSDLNLAESTVLAATTSSPTRYNPIKYPENNQKRRLIILSYMLRDGMISQEQYDAASGEDVYKSIQAYQETYTGQHAFSYFTDVVFEDVLERLQTELGYTDTQAYNLLYSGGLRIYTTQDPVIQKIVDEEVNDPQNYVVVSSSGSDEFLEYALTYRLSVSLRNGDIYYFDETNLLSYYRETRNIPRFSLNFASKEGLQAAVDEYREYLLTQLNATVVTESVTSTLEPQTSFVVMDPKTGHVKAVTGGRGDKNEIGSLAYNRATDATRQPGSSFKILSAYAPALDSSGATLATTVYDSPVFVNDRKISNWWGNISFGYANLRQGIMASMNGLAVKLSNNTVTVETGFDYAKAFGITTLAPDDENELMALGGLTYGVKNIEMTAAYSAIANDGVYTTPVFWTRVTDADGSILLSNEPETKTVLKATTAKLLTTAMESSIDSDNWWQPFPKNGVGMTSSECRVEGFGIAGKSGTTNDANDIWFIGYSPYYAAGIWSGYDSSKSFGTSPGYHKLIWQKVMTRIHENLEPKQFDYSGLVKVKICSKSGLLAKAGICDRSHDANCHIYEEFFAPGTEPTEYCNRHSSYQVCLISNKLATEYCPERYVISRTYLQIDAADNDGSQTVDMEYVIPQELASSSCDRHTGTTEPGETESEGENTGEGDGTETPGGENESSAEGETEPPSGSEDVIIIGN